MTPWRIFRRQKWMPKFMKEKLNHANIATWQSGLTLSETLNSNLKVQTSNKKPSFNRISVQTPILGRHLNNSSIHDSPRPPLEPYFSVATFSSLPMCACKSLPELPASTKQAPSHHHSHRHHDTQKYDRAQADVELCSGRGQARLWVDSGGAQ